MDTDGYTPAIEFEELLRLTRKYGPEALADEFERLAAVFRRQVHDLKPKSCPDCESRWDDEGGRAVTTALPTEAPQLQ